MDIKFHGGGGLFILFALLKPIDGMTMDGMNSGGLKGSSKEMRY